MANNIEKSLVKGTGRHIQAHSQNVHCDQGRVRFPLFDVILNLALLLGRTSCKIQSLYHPRGESRPASRKDCPIPVFERLGIALSAKILLCIYIGTDKELKRSV